MADEIREAAGVESELVRGGGGVFTVAVDGKVIFDKGETRRFPTEGEIAGILKS